MSWGKPKPPPPPPSTLSQVLPLIITLLVLGIVAFVGYQIYVSAMKVQALASKQMGSKNVVFTKEGVRVGVRHLENERYVDVTQSWLVKAWNMSSGEIEADKHAKRHPHTLTKNK